MTYTPEPLGQAAMSASVPVVIASDQTPLPVGGTPKQFAFAIPTTVAAYTSGMVVGGKIPILNVARVSGGTGFVQSALINKKIAVTSMFDLYLFHTDPVNSTFTDHAALNLVSADLPYLIDVISFGSYADNGTTKTLKASGLAIPFALAGTTMYVVPVIRGGETYVSTSDLSGLITALRD